MLNNLTLDIVFIVYHYFLRVITIFIRQKLEQLYQWPEATTALGSVGSHITGSCQKQTGWMVKD